MGAPTTVQGMSPIMLFNNSCMPAISSMDKTQRPIPSISHHRCHGSSWARRTRERCMANSAAMNKSPELNQVPKLSSSSRSKKAICQ